MRPDAINPGDVIGGKYRVRAVLGRTRGLLVEALHAEFDQRVVIRVLSPALLDEKEVGLFRREARLLAKLQTEHAARILDVGTLPDGTFYFARQYLEGMALPAYLEQHGALPLQDAVLMILQACEAVAETHAHDILLRELEPSHLFVAERLGGSPQLKLVDFGTAKLMRSAAAPTTGGEMTATAVCGLSCYASPELIRKTSHLDARADVWSLGAIFYRMLAGRPPFEGDLATLILKITREDPVSMTHWRHDVPAEMDDILRWAMAKDVDGRFVNVHAFAHALTPFASAEGQILIQRIGEITAAGKQRRAKGALAVSPYVSPASRSPRPATGDQPGLPSKAPTRRKSSVVLGASTVVLLSLIAAMVVVKSGPGRAPPEPSGAAVSPAATPPASAPSMPPTAASTVTQAPPVVTQAPPAGSSTGNGTSPVKTVAPKPKPPINPSPPTQPTATAAGKDGLGTILAAAIGGNCAFFVDGVSHGTASKLSLQVKAGDHTVMCRPSTGAAKSRSVSVEAGMPAMAVFKL